ncbi:MAG: protein-L-isoaspartate(D-aspartate) O-methyltransferase [Dehalobacterium sp.]|jgi:protein-L-isoaspartate(D-aspartate) O-methyltransferase
MDEQALVEFFMKLDRSFFLGDNYKALAHRDSPLPIGYEQTISQPSLVLEMTRILAPEKDSKVLEIGTGSGYQTALLAEFSGEVYTIERIEELSKKAQHRLSELGYKNIFFKIDDGSSGWEQKAPFDRIMVTAAAGKKPTKLINQLKTNGRMVVPTGPPSMQELLLITKDEKGNLKEQNLGQVRFVEMVGVYGWDQKNDD